MGWGGEGKGGGGEEEKRRKTMSFLGNENEGEITSMRTDVWCV